MKANKKTVYIFDFDSTFISKEGLDELAKESLKDHPDKDQRVQKIEELTQQGMEGKISFSHSLKERVKLLTTNKRLITLVGKRLSKTVSPSINRNKQFFQKHHNEIYIISGGFRELIEPVVQPFGIATDHIFANKFIYDSDDNVIGIDEQNDMSKDRGKVKTVQSLDVDGEVIMIGDGYTDYELKKFGHVKEFVAFTENVERDMVTQKADIVAPMFDEFLFVNDMSRALSYPLNRIGILVIGEYDINSFSELERHRFPVAFVANNNDIATEILENTSIVYLDKEHKHLETLLSKTKKLLAVVVPKNTVTISMANALQRKGIAMFTYDDRANVKKTHKRITSFINNGSINKSLNLPSISLTKRAHTHRLVHIHQNKPGIIAKIAHILSEHNCNIESQRLQTKGEIGYLITDIDKKYDEAVIRALRNIPETIRFRVIY